MKQIYSILTLCAALIVGFTHTAMACDESSAEWLGTTTEANGTYILNFEVCAEYSGLEGNPYEMIFTFSPSTVNVVNFSPASYDTSYPDTYTGSANDNVLTYDGVFLPVHNEVTLCNTFAIQVDAFAEQVDIQTNDYPAATCTKTFLFDSTVDPICLESPMKSIMLLELPLGLQSAVSETIDGDTYAPFYDAYKLRFSGGTPPYSFSGSISSNAVKYKLNRQAGEIVIYGPVSSTWEIIVTDANDCVNIFDRPAHVVPVISGETAPLHISDYTITSASSNSAYNGAIDITPTTGLNNPSYDFLWLESLSANAPFATTEDVSNLNKSTYYMNVNDGDANFLCAFIVPVQSNKNEVDEIALLFEDITTTSVNIYPNPVSDRAYVNITTNEAAEAMVELYNINGQKVATIFEGNLDISNQIVFSTENLSNGLYFVKTTTSTGFQDAYKIQVLK
ncbi:MAG: T9SS type A sorting domain-containing protein [Chitinophagales bacterium]